MSWLGWAVGVMWMVALQHEELERQARRRREQVIDQITARRRQRLRAGIERIRHEELNRASRLH